MAACFVVTLLLLGYHIRGMGQGSLWQDEIYSIEKYSALGCHHTLTTYHEPNNHVLFNAMTSLGPYAGSFHPAQARWISTIAVASSFVLLGIGFLLRRQISAGAGACVLLASSPELMERVLEARGYGLQFFSACIIVIALLRARRNRVGFAWISVAILIGTWSVPTFALFAASLFFVALVFEFRLWKSTFAWALATATAVLVAYAPILPDLQRASSNYTSEVSLSGFASLVELFADYLPGDFWNTWSTAMLLAGLGLSILFSRDRRVHWLASSSLLFLGLCLLWKKPISRSVAFIIVPIIASLSVTAVQLSRRLPSTLSFLIAIPALFLLLSHSKNVLCSSYPAPRENWRGIAMAIDSLVSPQTKVICPFRPGNLSIYLNHEEYELIEEGLDQTALDRHQVARVFNGPKRERPSAPSPSSPSSPNSPNSPNSPSSPSSLSSLRLLIPQTRFAPAEVLWPCPSHYARLVETSRTQKDEVTTHVYVIPSDCSDVHVLSDTPILDSRRFEMRIIETNEDKSHVETPLVIGNLVTLSWPLIDGPTQLLIQIDGSRRKHRWEPESVIAVRGH